MPLVTSKEMFEKAYKGGYAIGAFNVNNMEMIQAIVEAANECRSPVILQVSAGARKYANPVYLKHLVAAAVETTDIPIVMHLDPRRRFRHLQSLYRRRLYFRYDRCLLQALGREHCPYTQGCGIRPRPRRSRRGGAGQACRRRGRRARGGGRRIVSPAPTKWKNSPPERA